MSKLRDLLTQTKDVVYTAEFPVIDGGGMEQVKKNVDRCSALSTRSVVEEKLYGHKLLPRCISSLV